MRRDFVYDRPCLSHSAFPRPWSVSLTASVKCSKGVDVCFDNTGGPIHDAVMRNLSIGVQVIICGRIALAAQFSKPDIGERFMGQLIMSRASDHGFLVFDWWHSEMRRSGVSRNGKLQEKFISKRMYSMGSSVCRKHFCDCCTARISASKSRGPRRRARLRATFAKPSTNFTEFFAFLLRPDVNSPRHCGLHMYRAKGGDASVHPISTRESRALRKLLREADQGHGSHPDLASVLQDGGQSANMYIRSGAIWEISAKYQFTHEMKTLLAGLILIHSWYPNECCAEKDCHPVPCDEISEGENGAMHWKN